MSVTNPCPETVILPIIEDILQAVNNKSDCELKDEVIDYHVGESANQHTLSVDPREINEDNSLEAKNSNSYIESGQLVSPKNKICLKTFVQALDLSPLTPPFIFEQEETTLKNNEGAVNAYDRKETVHFSSPIASIHEYSVSQESCDSTQSLCDDSPCDEPVKANKEKYHHEIEILEKGDMKSDWPQLMTPAGDCTNSSITDSVLKECINKQEDTEESSAEPTINETPCDGINDKEKSICETPMLCKLDTKCSAGIEHFEKVQIEVSSSPELFSSVMELPNMQKTSDNYPSEESPAQLPANSADSTYTDGKVCEIQVDKDKIESLEHIDADEKGDCQENIEQVMPFKLEELDRTEQEELDRTEEELHRIATESKVSKQDISYPSIDIKCTNSPDLFVNTQEEMLPSRNVIDSQDEYGITTSITANIHGGKRKINSQDSSMHISKKQKMDNMDVKEQTVTPLKRAMSIQDTTETTCPQKQQKFTISSTYPAATKFLPKELKLLATEKLEYMKEEVLWKSNPEETSRNLSPCKNDVNHDQSNTNLLQKEEHHVHVKLDRVVEETQKIAVCENISPVLDTFDVERMTLGICEGNVDARNVQEYTSASLEESKRNLIFDNKDVKQNIGKDIDIKENNKKDISSVEEECKSNLSLDKEFEKSNNILDPYSLSTFETEKENVKNIDRSNISQEEEQHIDILKVDTSNEILKAEIQNTNETLHSNKTKVTDEICSSVLENEIDEHCDTKFISATEYLSQTSQCSYCSSTGFIYDQNKSPDCLCPSQTSSTQSSDRSFDKEKMLNDEELNVDLETKFCLEVVGGTDASYPIDETRLKAGPVTDIDVDTDVLDAMVVKAIDQLVSEDEITHDTTSVDLVPDDKIAVDGHTDDPDSVSLYDNHGDGKNRFYSCDVDLRDEADRPVCSPVDKKGCSDTQHSGGRCFKWTYAPSLCTEAAVPESDDDNKTVTLKPMQTCNKPIRLGLSKKRQPVHKLHKF